MQLSQERRRGVKRKCLRKVDIESGRACSGATDALESPVALELASSMMQLDDTRARQS